jgi:RecB family endonuclease NucS
VCGPFVAVYVDHRVIESPDSETVADLLGECKRRRACLVLHARCEVDYDGRASSTLAAGDRMIVYKPDGSLLIHTDEGREPQNWQPPGATVQVTEHDPLTLIAIRSTPKEVIKLVCLEVGLASLMRMDDDATLDLHGSEEDLRTHIFENPDVIEEGFRPRAKEYETPAGPVDVYGADADGQPVILELKRRRVGPDAVSQLRRYVESVDGDTRGILVAASITDRARTLLEQFSLEHRQVAPPNREQTVDRSLEEFGE